MPTRGKLFEYAVDVDRVGRMTIPGGASVEPAEGYSGKWQLRAPKSLHRKLADRAKREGVSLNTLILTALAQYVGSENVRGGAISPKRKQFC